MNRSIYILYVWPFSFFKNANVGNRYQAILAAEHNRRMASYLPAYMFRWFIIAGVLLALLMLFKEPLSVLASIIAGALGIGFSCSVVVLTVIFVSYIFLIRTK